MENDFTVTLCDTTSRIISPLNTVLDFESFEYEVCLQDVIFATNSWCPFQESAAWVELVKLDKDLTHVEYRTRFYLDVRRFVSNDDLILHFNAKLYRHHMDDHTLRFDWVSKDNGIFRVAGKINTYQYRAYKDEYLLQFSPELNYLLGVTLSIYDKSATKLYNGFLFDNSIDITRYTFEKLWIHADFIRPKIVGSKYYPLLGSIALDISNSSVSHKIQSKFYYSPIFRSKLSTLKLTIFDTIDGSGNFVIFEPFTLTLHFQKRSKIPLRIYDGFPVIVSFNRNNTHVRLNTTLDFREANYQVTLREMRINEFGWFKIRKDANIIDVIYPNGNIKKVSFEVGPYLTVKEVYDSIDAALAKGTAYETFITNKQGTKDFYGKLIGPHKIRFTNQVNYILGITKQLTVDPPILRDGYEFYNTNVDFNRWTVEKYCILADFVDETMIGNKSINLLRIIPATVDTYNYSLVTDEFVNVQQRQIKNLCFQIKESLFSPHLLFFVSTFTFGLYFQEL